MILPGPGFSLLKRCRARISSVYHLIHFKGSSSLMPGYHFISIPSIFKFYFTIIITEKNDVFVSRANQMAKTENQSKQGSDSQHFDAVNVLDMYISAIVILSQPKRILFAYECQKMVLLSISVPNNRSCWILDCCYKSTSKYLLINNSYLYP